jgi:hypothetical protein
MRKVRKLCASLVAIAALALIAATTVAAGSPHATYTCVKVKENGKSDVRVQVPESAVGGLTNAGFTCVADAVHESEDEDEGPGNEPGPTNEPSESEDEDPANEPGPSNEQELGSGQGSSGVAEVGVPEEARSLYCSTNGPAFRANGEGMGIALNLFSSQGALLVEMGLATQAIFYQGIGASCDLLPGFTYSGTWVDNVGEVVPGVAVYPLYVPTTG